MPLSTLSLAVVGCDYPNKRGPTRRFEIAICKPGERVHLIPEPKNPADPRAVVVQTDRGVTIGYLSAERCGWIGGMIANGRKIAAIFQQATASGATIRVAFDGALPDLPTPKMAPQAGSDDDSGFYPDEIPNDDL